MPAKPKNKPLRRYPATKLLERIKGHDTHISDILGIRRVTVSRWRTENTQLTCWLADRYAIKAGYHPAQIWSDWLDIHPPQTN
jgi:hypothetical protein